MIGRMRDLIGGKIDLVRCDVHRICGMRPVTIRTVSQTGDINDIDALRCELPECIRHYRTDFGYYNQELGGRPDRDPEEAHPRCGEHTSPPRLFVEQINPDEWRYSCPIDGCETHRPLEG